MDREFQFKQDKLMVEYLREDGILVDVVSNFLFQEVDPKMTQFPY